MKTRDTIRAYFDALMERRDWQSYLADDMAFASFGTPAKTLAGRAPYIESTKRFFSIIKRVEVLQILVDGNRACALTRYDLQPPSGRAFESNVAEIFTVQNSRISSLSIYFDSAPFPK